MKSALALAFAGALVAALWAATPAQATTSSTKWPHWNQTARDDLQDGCSQILADRTLAAGAFIEMSSDQHLRGRTKTVLAVVSQLRAGNSGPARAVCAQAKIAGAVATTTTTVPPEFPKVVPLSAVPDPRIQSGLTDDGQVPVTNVVEVAPGVYANEGSAGLQPIDAYTSVFGLCADVNAFVATGHQVGDECW